MEMAQLTSAVTALRFVRFTNPSIEPALQSTFLLAGIGSRIRVYSAASNFPVLVKQVLPSGIRIHAFSKPCNLRIMVHGSRYVAVLRAHFVNSQFQDIIVEHSYEFPDWVWNTLWLCAGEYVAVACGHSTVHICTTQSLNSSISVQSSEKELSWSTALYTSFNGDYLGALSGTSFGDVLSWRPFLSLSLDFLSSLFQTSSKSLNSHRHQLLPVEPEVHRLKAHDGPVMHIALSSDATRMATASVDRTVRVWLKKPSQCTPCGNNCFYLGYAHYGHNARVWQVAFLDGSDVVSVGEDRSCRIWRMRNGQLFKSTFRSHLGRNIWSLAVQGLEKGACVATGGEDGAIWRRIIPYEEQPDLKRFVKGSFQIPGKYRNPRKRDSTLNECGRSLFIQENNVIVSTDFGRVLSCAVSFPPKTGYVLDASTVRWRELYRDEGGTAFTPNSLCVCDGLVFGGQTNGHVIVIKLDNAKDVSEDPRNLLSTDIFEEQSLVMGIYTQRCSEGVHLFVASAAGELRHWLISREKDQLNASYRGLYGMKRRVKSALVTALLLVPGFDVLIVGDRGGRLLLYDLEGSELNESACAIHPVNICQVHEDRISDMKVIGNVNGDSLVLKTAGFDGYLSKVIVRLREKVAEFSCREKVIAHVETVSKLVRANELDEELHAVIFRGSEMGVVDANGITRLRENVGNWRRAHDVQISEIAEGQVMVIAAWWRSQHLEVSRWTSDSVVAERTSDQFHGIRANCVVWCGDDETIMSGGEDTIVLRSVTCGGVWMHTDRLQGHLSSVNDIDVVRRCDLAVSVGGCDQLVIWESDGVHWRESGSVQLQEKAVAKRAQGVGWQQSEALHRAWCVCLLECGCENELGCVHALIGRSDGSIVGMWAWRQKRDISKPRQTEWEIEVNILDDCDGGIRGIGVYGDYVVAGDSRGGVHIYQMVSGCDKVVLRKAGEMQLGSAVNCMDVKGGQNGSLLIACGGDDESVRLLSWSDGKVVQKWCDNSTHCAGLAGVCFAVEEERVCVVSVGRDQRVCVWRLEMNESTAMKKLHLVRCDVCHCSDVVARLRGNWLVAIVVGVGVEKIRLQVE